MRLTRRSCIPLTVFASVVVVGGVSAGPEDTNRPGGNQTSTANPKAEVWSVAVSGYLYFPPDDTNYIQPTVTADHGRIHLEARANYEEKGSVSSWLGWNWNLDGRVSLAITPQIGIVFGKFSGIAPGYEGSVTWGKLELYSEGEYAYELSDSSKSYFYNWSTLTYELARGFRFGTVVQRTRVYQAERDLQRGLLLGFSHGRSSITAHILNLDSSAPTYVMSVVVQL